MAGEKGYFQLISGLNETPATTAEAPKSLVSIFTSAVKSAVSSSPASATTGALGEIDRHGQRQTLASKSIFIQMEGVGKYLYTTVCNIIL